MWCDVAIVGFDLFGWCFVYFFGFGLLGWLFIAFCVVALLVIGCWWWVERDGWLWFIFVVFVDDLFSCGFA